MDQSERYSVEAYRLPLSMEDHEGIGRMLHDREVFAPTFVPQADADVYNPLLYRHENLQHNTTTILLADRNVVTRWLALLAGKTPAPQDRLAAAIMVFAQSANILIEPNLALYEAAMAEGSEQANQELVQFRIADNLDIKHWADLALGRKQKLSIPERALADIPKKPDAINFEIRLRRWSRNYIILLKLAELELRGLDRTRQITEFATWMYQDFIVGGPVLIFALYYLTPNSERSGLLKHLRSADRERALSGIRNASWDLTLLSEWIRRAGTQKEINTLTLLCSFDRKLIILARILAPRLASNLTDEEFRRSSMMAILELWGKKQADQIVGLIGRFIASPDNPSRQIHRPDEVDIKGMIQAGEKFVRDWRA